MTIYDATILAIGTIIISIGLLYTGYIIGYERGESKRTCPTLDQMLGLDTRLT